MITIISRAKWTRIMTILWRIKLCEDIWITRPIWKRRKARVWIIKISHSSKQLIGTRAGSPTSPVAACLRHTTTFHQSTSPLTASSKLKTKWTRASSRTFRSKVWSSRPKEGHRSRKETKHTSENRKFKVTHCKNSASSSRAPRLLPSSRSKKDPTIHWWPKMMAYPCL